MPRRRRGAVSGTRGGSSPDLCDDEDGVCTREKPQQRNAANARERARMRVLSKAFCRLKTTLPWVPADTKLSKLDTLRLATSYIAHLRAILTDEVAEVAPIHPLNLVSHELHPFHATHKITRLKPFVTIDCTYFVSQVISVTYLPHLLGVTHNNIRGFPTIYITNHHGHKITEDVLFK
jgi:hypothetical protein